jgi:hypothetical protein
MEFCVVYVDLMDNWGIRLMSFLLLEGWIAKLEILII